MTQSDSDSETLVKDIQWDALQLSQLFKYNYKYKCFEYNHKYKYNYKCFEYNHNYNCKKITQNDTNANRVENNLISYQIEQQKMLKNEK